MKSPDQLHRIKLYTLLSKQYNISELKTLCFHLGIDYESLAGEGKADKVRELILHCQRHQRITELKNQVLRERPTISSPNMSTSPSRTVDSYINPTQAANESNKKALDNICWTLLEILNQFENIDDPTVLESLLQIGFEVPEIRPIRRFVRQNASSTTANLTYIVNGVRKLEKLDALIRAAKVHTQNRELLRQLNQIEQDYNEYKQRGTIQTPPSSLPKSINIEDTKLYPVKIPYQPRYRHAFLVGVTNYVDPSYSALPACATDVRQIYNIFKNGGFQSGQIRLVTNRTPDTPTAVTITQSLEEVAANTRSDDLLLFYYSGHGAVANGRSYLVTQDSSANDLERTAVSITTIKEIMQNAKAKAKVIIIDACRSGDQLISKGADEAEDETRNKFIRYVFEEAEGLAILTSCQQNEKSYLLDSNEMSLFTYYLVEILSQENEDAFVTFTQAAEYVTGGLKTSLANKPYSQTPKTEFSGVGDIILVDYRNRL